MSFLWESLKQAVDLALAFDRELYSIVAVSLQVSAASTVFASVLGIPLGFALAIRPWRGQRLAIAFFNTMLALPTVVIGLFVYAFISRQGVFGPLDLLYTRTAIVIGQTLLIFPLVTSLAISAVSRIDARYRATAMTLGANRVQTAWVIFREARFALCAAVITAFGRVIAEVGISMMLGGNIEGHTRTITTAMALEYDKGTFVLAIALGMILMAIALGINLIFHMLQGRIER